MSTTVRVVRSERNIVKDTHLLIIGAGNVGTHTLDLLARRHDAPRITVAGRDSEHLIRQLNLSRLVATQLGYIPRLDYVPMDVNDIDQTAETIARLRPDVIFSTVSLQAWWVINELPKNLLERLDSAEIGPWLPMQLTLIYKVMQAVRMADCAPVVVNVALPDATHAILDKVGLAPNIGVGNVANIVPAIRHAAANELGVEVTQVDVRLIMEAYASHRLPRSGEAGGAPFYVSILHNGIEVRQNIDIDAVLKRVASQYRRLGGVRGAVLTAASAVRVLEAVCGQEHRLVHAPGPLGLVGGYPVNVSRFSSELALPLGVTVEQARDINERSLWYDGIAEIRADGSVRYSDPHMDIIRDMLGYDVREMRLEDSEAFARELGERYAMYRKSVMS